MVIIIGAKTTIVSHKAHKRGWFHAANTAGFTQRAQRSKEHSKAELFRCAAAPLCSLRETDSDKTFGTGHFGQPRFIQLVDNKFFVSGICIET